MRAARVSRDPRIRETLGIILTDLDEALGDDIGLETARRCVGVFVGDLAEVAEGLHGVLRDALAVLVHHPELPEGHRLTSRSGILKRGQSRSARDATAGAVEAIGEVEGSVNGGRRHAL